MTFTAKPAHNEFRSDTFTTPTASMVEALALSTVGDSVYNEDDLTKQLEAKVAALAGKEAGLFCVSGTLLNQIALRSHLFQPPHSVLCDYRLHVYSNEAGGLATLSQAMVQTIIPKNGNYLTLEDDILPNFIPDDGEIHGAPTKVISLENTLHGMLFPVEEVEKISAFCRANDVRLHLDGARLWNAVVETGIELHEYTRHFDSVSLCLSKTLGAPVGSVLVGETRFITKANHFKKQNGGGIRQSGLLAVMASTAIDENFPKLKQTHAWAKEVGEFLTANGIKLLHPVETNFVFIDLRANRINPKELAAAAVENGVIVGEYGRLAFHYQLSRESIDTVKRVVLEVYQKALKQPYEPAARIVAY